MNNGARWIFNSGNMSALGQAYRCDSFSYYYANINLCGVCSVKEIVNREQSHVGLSDRRQFINQLYVVQLASSFNSHKPISLNILLDNVTRIDNSSASVSSLAVFEIILIVCFLCSVFTLCSHWLFTNYKINVHFIK